jgi:hypothetical protein
VAERRDNAPVLGAPAGRALTRHARRLARRLASLGDARLSALHRGDFGPGAALFPHPELLPDRLQRAPRARVVVPAGGVPSLPGQTIASRRRGTATPRSAFRIASRSAPQKRGCESILCIADRSQQKNSFRERPHIGGSMYVQLGRDGGAPAGFCHPAAQRVLAARGPAWCSRFPHSGKRGFAIGYNLRLAILRRNALLACIPSRTIQNDSDLAQGPAPRLTAQSGWAIVSQRLNRSRKLKETALVHVKRARQEQ